jgi:hypothetical protein
MQRAVAQSRANILVTGIVAGLIGGVLIESFLAIANHANVIQIWQFVASGVVGGVAFTSSNYAVLGFAMHFAISIVWATIYTWAALGPLPTLARHPVVSGLLYGAVVMIGMDVLLIVKHVGPGGLPDPGSLFISLIAHTVFFGLPVALFVGKTARS